MDRNKKNSAIIERLKTISFCLEKNETCAVLNQNSQTTAIITIRNDVVKFL